MCGLTSIFRPDGGAVNAAVLRRMTDSIAYRGPDGDGFHTEPHVGLGHRRLAIVDVAGGHQPMFNEDGSVAIVFNGEIYNFPELRPKLQALGHVFRNRCDTEAIIHAWESFGPGCLEHLDGMFAFVLWDRNRGTLFMARDRLGKKPLHYAIADETLYVGSELRCFAQVPGLERRIDPCAVEDFFAFGYVQDPRTIFSGIRKLPAAHYLMLRAGEALRPAPVRYWRPAIAPVAIGIGDAADALDRRLEAATRARLMADVPLGAFLSGGVDSSGVVAVAAKLRQAAGDGALDTFTIGFQGDEDETPYAAMVASRYGTNQHNETAAATDWIAEAGRQGALFGEPFGDSSAVPTRSVCALARRHATVALSGDGGDEVFGGYRRYRWHSLLEGVRAWLPAPVRGRVVGELARIYPKLDRAPRWLRAKHTLTELSLDSALGYYRMVARVQHDLRRAMLSPSMETTLDGYDPQSCIPALMQESGSDDPLVQAQYADLQTWLVGDILTKVDRASMACSLEVRAPLLDHEMVSWGLSLPASLKLRGAEGKFVLKRALERLVPREVLYRPKQGFATSLAAPLRAGAERVRRRLLGPVMMDSGLFDAATLGQLIDEHERGRFDHSAPLWLLLVFEGFLASELAGQVLPQDDAVAA